MSAHHASALTAKQFYKGLWFFATFLVELKSGTDGSIAWALDRLKELSEAP